MIRQQYPLLLRPLIRIGAEGAEVRTGRELVPAPDRPHDQGDAQRTGRAGLLALLIGTPPPSAAL